MWGAGRRLRGPAGAGSRVHHVQMPRSVEAGAGRPPAGGHAAAAWWGRPGSGPSTRHSRSSTSSTRCSGTSARRRAVAQPAAAARVDGLAQTAIAAGARTAGQLRTPQLAWMLWGGMDHMRWRQCPSAAAKSSAAAHGRSAGGREHSNSTRLPACSQCQQQLAASRAASSCGKQAGRGARSCAAGRRLAAALPWLTRTRQSAVLIDPRLAPPLLCRAAVPEALRHQEEAGQEGQAEPPHPPLDPVRHGAPTLATEPCCLGCCCRSRPSLGLTCLAPLCHPCPPAAGSAPTTPSGEHGSWEWLPKQAQLLRVTEAERRHSSP